MRYAIITLAAVGALLLWWGRRVETTAPDNDMRMSSVIPCVVGAFVLVADFVLLIAYALYRLLWT